MSMATIGIAAVTVGGTTLHKWVGGNNWLTTDVLIIDEISMISGSTFDLFEALARDFRKNDAPWGGMQVIVCGDFCQLPPVSRVYAE